MPMFNTPECNLFLQLTGFSFIKTSVIINDNKIESIFKKQQFIDFDSTLLSISFKPFYKLVEYSSKL
jgi:hypothetical protein